MIADYWKTGDATNESRIIGRRVILPMIADYWKTGDTTNNGRKIIGRREMLPMIAEDGRYYQ